MSCMENSNEPNRFCKALREVSFSEVMQDVRTRSEVVVLDFAQIDPALAAHKNIRKFFEECTAQGMNPRLPEQRQRFNENFLRKSGKRYLIGRYGEDRSALLPDSKIKREKRTIHLGVDIFSKKCETVFCPCDGYIVHTGYERPLGYGFYVIIEHTTLGLKWYSFFGHLSKELPQKGPVAAGVRIGTLGDFKNNENGSWSRHLHYQLLLALPPEGIAPLGYATPQDFEKMSKLYPNPNMVLKLPCLADTKLY